MSFNNLSALVGSWICHYLICPIHAIGNGVELLIMEGHPQSPEISLISESVTNANTHIQFFSVGFEATGQDQLIVQSEVLAILADPRLGGWFNIAWHSRKTLTTSMCNRLFCCWCAWKALCPLAAVLRPN